MSNITLDEMAPLLTREASARRRTLLGIFALVSLLFLAVAFLWQKKFTSYTQIAVDDSRIVAPIVGAETTSDRDQANIAREELFNNVILETILDGVDRGEGAMSAAERERAKQDIINNTDVYNIENQLLEITYWDSDPRVAFETVTLFADLFLERAMASSSEETSDAFDFITNQVETYRNKLEDAEARLESFRRQYPGVSTNTEGGIESRVIELQRDLESTQLQLAQADQRRRSLERELSSESSTIARDYETGRVRDQIAALQAEIETLRLNYTDDYPDIIRLNQQIEDIRANAAAPRPTTGDGQSVFNLGGNAYLGSSRLSPVYQQLRSDLARTAAEADALRSRRDQLSVLLANETERSTLSSRVERELAELSRDYQINKELYEDLLRRQESARLSMTLGAEKQGVLYRIVEPPNFPVLPNGLRFMHIALIGHRASPSTLPFRLPVRLPQARSAHPHQLRGDRCPRAASAERRAATWCSRTRSAGSSNVPWPSSVPSRWSACCTSWCSSSSTRWRPRPPEAGSYDRSSEDRQCPLDARSAAGQGHRRRLGKSKASRALVPDRPPPGRRHAAAARPTTRSRSPIGRAPSSPTWRRRSSSAIASSICSASSTPRSKDRQLVDAFRQLRTKLYSLREGNFSVMVSSVVPGGGGSFVALNLAATIAFDKAKTSLLVDANLNDPIVHRLQRLIGLDESHGLLEYLEHPELGVEHIVSPSGVPRMRVIPIGRAPPRWVPSIFTSGALSPADGRHPDALRQPLRRRRRTTGDVRPRADARILSDICDYTVLVLPYGGVTPGTLDALVDEIDERRLAGVVINDQPR